MTMKEVIKAGAIGVWQTRDFVGSAEQWVKTLMYSSDEKKTYGSPCYRTWTEPNGNYVYCYYTDGYGQDWKLGYTHKIIADYAWKRHELWRGL